LIAMTAFEFATAQRIIFGEGAFDQLGKLTAAHGKHVFLVATASALTPGGPADRLADQLRVDGVTMTRHPVDGEPEVEAVDATVEAARTAGAEVVVGIGGGSALDTAKAVAGLLTNGGSALDYMEVVGQGKLLRKPALPFLAVPTTAGPGAEVTRNAVVL
jgi:alcohol dehydrogenase class IV